MPHTLIDIMRLGRSDNVGPVTFRKMMAYFGSVDKALTALLDNPKVMGRYVTLAPLDKVQAEYETGVKLGAICITQADKAYPEALRHAPDAPPFFWMMGNKDILQKMGCSIVGSRNASVGGRKIAYSLAQNIAKEGFITVSGLARGIDAAAHEGSLKIGTIAVVAGGVDNIYPSEHKQLYHAIIENGGAIISENPPLTEPKGTLFPRRNRIISGLSLAVVIIEAGLKSGSLTTADFALGQGREVFAVPGSPLDPRAAGPNKLLKNGASWAENSEDVLSYLRAMREKQKPFIEKDAEKIKVSDGLRLALAETPPKTNPMLESATDDFLNLFGTAPISGDEVIRVSGKSSAEAIALLAEYELTGDIERMAGNMFVKIPKKLAHCA